MMLRLLLVIIALTLSPTLQAAASIPARHMTEPQGTVVDDYSKGKFFGGFADDRGSYINAQVVESAEGNAILKLDYERQPGGYVGLWHKVNMSFTKNRQDWSTAKELRFDVYSVDPVPMELVLKNGEQEIASTRFEVLGGAHWRTIALPLADFEGIEAGISDVTDFNLKPLEPGQNTVYIDDIRVIDAEAAADAAPSHPGARMAAVTADEAFGKTRASIPDEVSNRTLLVQALNGDADGDGSAQRPFNTIQDAIDVALPGDTVLVGPGTYMHMSEPGQNAIVIERSGRPGHPITLKAEPNRPRPLLVGNGWNVIGVRNATHVRIQGFRITGGVHPEKGHNTTSGVGIKHSAHIEVIDNHIHDLGGGGVGARHSDYLTIDGNRIERTSYRNIYNTSAISLFEIRDYDDAPGVHNVIRNNLCFRNENKGPTPLYGGKLTDGNGIIIDHHRGTGGILVENNICVDNGGRGINVFKAHNIVVRHNTLVYNGRTPDSSRPDVGANSSDNVLYVNNLIVARPGSVMTTSWKQGEDVRYSNNVFAGFDSIDLDGMDDTNLVVDANVLDLPLLDTIINGDLSTIEVTMLIPSPISPAVDAATTRQVPTDDIRGTLRPQGAAAEIGAIELKVDN